MSYKLEHLMNAVEDAISSALYYDRKECEDLTILDVEDLFEDCGMDLADAIAEHVRSVIFNKFL